MNKNDDNKKRLYDTLSEDYDMGTYEQFSADIQDEGKRRKLYDATSNEYDYGGYDKFSEQLGYEAAQEPVEEKKPEPTWTNIGDRTVKDTKEKFGYEIKGQDRTTVIPEAPDDDSEGYDVGNTEYMQKKQLEQANRDQVASLSKDIDTRLEDAMKRSSDSYMSDLEDARKGGFWKSLSFAMSNSAPGPAQPGASGVNTIMKAEGRNPELSKEIKDLEAARRAMNDARKIIEEADKNELDYRNWWQQTFAAGAARGFGQKLFDARTWDMGATDIQDGSALMVALDKFDSGDELTDSERMLLDAKAVELATNAYFGSYIGRGYKAGGVTAESIPFMIEMCINPASAAGKTATSKLTRYALKRFGKKAISEGAGKALYSASKVGTRVAADAAGAMAMAGTTGATGVAADAIDRMNGNVQFGVDSEGQSYFSSHEEGEEPGAAFRKAFASRAIENHSEMLGQYFQPVLGAAGKGIRAGLDKIGLGKVNKFIDDVSASDLARIVDDFEKHSKWNGLIGEYAEEVAGGIENAIVVGDQTLDAAEGTGVFNLDQNIDTFLGVALMGGVLSSVKTAGYRTPKYRAKKAMSYADANAQAVFGEERWNEIKDELEASPDEESTVRSISENLASLDNRDKKSAFLDYIQASQFYRGTVLGEPKRRSELEEPVQVDAETSYDNGYTLDTQQEMNDAKNMFEYQQTRLKDMLDMDDISAEQAFTVNDLPLSDEQKQVAVDYLNAKATYDGMIDRVRDDIDSRMNAADKVIESNMNVDTRMIIPATMKVDDRKVYVVGGQIAMNDDNTMIDKERTDETVIIRDAETGKLELADPSNILRIDEQLDPEEEKSTVHEQIRQQIAEEAARKIDGVLPFVSGDTYMLTNDAGETFPVQIAPDENGIVDNGDGTVNVIVNNAQNEGRPLVSRMGKQDIQDMADMTNIARLARFEKEKTETKAEVEREAAEAQHPYSLGDVILLRKPDGSTTFASVLAPADNDGMIQIESQEPIKDGKPISAFSRDELESMMQDYVGPVPEDWDSSKYVPSQAAATSAQGEEEQNVSATADRLQGAQPSAEAGRPERALDRIPVSETGEQRFEDAPVEDTWNALVELNEGDTDEARDTATQMLNNTQKALERAEKAKTGGNNVIDIQKQKAAKRANVQRLKKNMSYWTSVVNFEEDRRKAAEEEARRQKRLRLAEARRIQRQNGRYGKEDAGLGDYIDFRDYVMRTIANGFVKFKWADDKNNPAIKGLGSHLGLTGSQAEMGRRIWMLSNEDGMRPEEAAESMLQSYAESLGLESVEQTGLDTMSALDEILDVVRSYDGSRSMFDAAKRNHEQANYDPMAEGTHLDEIAGEAPAVVENGEAAVEEAPEEATPDEENSELAARFTDLENDTVEEGENGPVYIRQYQFDNDPRLITETNAPDANGNYTGAVYNVDGNDFGDLIEVADYLVSNAPVTSVIEQARQEVDIQPSEAQKEAGNYKMGHVSIDGLNITLENPKGSTRRGKDASGKEWHTEMHNDYGYIRGTGGVDGDHIDIFLSDDPAAGKVYVIDQVNRDGSFDEHKVMYGFASEDEARSAYLSNYEKGWTGLGNITEVSKDAFRKWISSSKRKTKPFAEYKTVEKENTENTVQGLEAYSPDEIKGIVRDHIESVLHENNLDAEVTGIEINGSRKRGDARNDSDLDIVVEYSGDIREDDMFNLLNNDDIRFTIEGIPVDINPIRPQQSGSLEYYMQRSREYDKEKQDAAHVQGKTEAPGDWEKAARIGKLRHAVPVEISGNEIEPSDDLKQYRKNALEYGKKLRGEYINKDTGNIIALSSGNKNGGLKEVLQHDTNDIAHLQSVAAIPGIIENGIYITSVENEDLEKNPNVVRYHYYVCGLKIGDSDYTVKAVVAEQNNGNRYYDHKLTSIEKGKLLEELTLINHTSPSGLSSTGESGETKQSRPAAERGETQNSPISNVKDKRLLSILQTNPSKTVGDDNGPAGNAGAFPSSEDDIRFREDENVHTDEERRIIDAAKKDGTYMKAPNGADSNLTERQWVQVRTKAFKEWFGDWEKAARIGKLRHAAPVKMTGDEYKGKYELNRDSAKQWMKDNLRGEYTNADTGESIEISKVGVNKVTSHGERDEAHLKSIVAIPQLIENSIFIEERTNEKNNDKYDSYRYYVCGLKIDGEDYTAKIVIGVKGDSKYYDHRLTQIEKGTLIDNLNGLANSVAENQNASISDVKDTKLVSILQTNASKVVDKNGEPRVVYHGSPFEFNAFSYENFGRTDGGNSGIGFYFTPVSRRASRYAGDGGNVKAVFLNMKNPYIDYSWGTDAISDSVVFNSTRKQLADRFREQLAVMQYEGASDADISSAENMMNDFISRYQELSEKMEGKDGVVSVSSSGDVYEYVVKSPNQIKSATDNTGLFSTEEDDIRYRDNEVKRELIGVHNLNEDSLRKALELGGFPMPSIAVTKADVGHTSFGDISLVFDKESIDPTDRRNKVYGEDAWTPTFPQTGYKLNDDKTDDIYRRANKIGNLPFFHPTDFHPDNYEKFIEGLDSESLVKHFKENYGAKQFYLAEIGNAVENYEQHEVEKYPADRIAFYEKVLEEIGLERLKNESREALEDEMRQLLGQYYGIDFENIKPFRVKVLIDNSIRAAIDYAENGNRKWESDIDGTKRKIDERVNAGKFEKWLQNLFTDIVEKKGIRNDRDPFTPSGNRRKWEQLYDEVTLDNVVKAMQRQAEKGGQGLFGGSIFGAAQKEYKSIDEIRKAARERIRLLDDAEADAARNAITDRLSHVEIPSDRKRSMSDTFDMVENITDAVSKSHTPKGIYNHLRSIYPKMTMDVANEIADIVRDIQQMSARYFEAKPRRAVGFEEVRLAVVPEGTDEALVIQLENHGIPVRYYKKDNQDQRRQIVSEAADELELLFRHPEIKDVNKDKGLSGISSASSNYQQEIGKQDPDFAANKIRNFENPAIPAKDMPEGERNVGASTPVGRRKMAERVKNLADMLHLDNVEIIMDTSRLKGKKSQAKGFYIRSTGKIAVVIPNNLDVTDAVQTLLHEAVAHYGLRQMFGDHFDTFLDNVFNSADAEVRKRIIDLRRNYYYRQYVKNAVKGISSPFEQAAAVAALPKSEKDFTRVATEEYLASLAERTNFEKMRKSSWWQKIKDFFAEMLDKIGLYDLKGLSLSDNELRYILWRSYENLRGGRESNIFSEAADIAMQYELGVGEYSSDTADLAEVNRKFNEELQQQVDGTLPVGHIYRLGRPGALLRSAGFPDLPIEMSATRLAEKSRQKNHPFDMSAMKDLVRQLNDPIAVFKYGNNAKNVIVGIEYGGKQFLVGVHFNQTHRGSEISDIRGIFPKDNAEWLNWIAQGKADYLNKREIQDLIDKQRINLAEVEYLDLDSVTKLVENFENPAVRYRNLTRDADDLAEVNRKFNEELGGLTDDNADRVILSLGKPSPVLKAAGVVDKPMKLYGNKVMKKMKKHGFALAELRDLPRAVADPIAVFENYGRRGNRSILTELKTKQGNVLVTLTLGEGQDVDFNIVTSVFGKGDGNIIDWIEKGYATYIDKAKTLDYLHHSALRAVTSNSQEPNSIANIGENSDNLQEAPGNGEKIKDLDSVIKAVESFENPPVEGEPGTDGDIRYRSSVPGTPVSSVAQELYNEKVRVVNGKGKKSMVANLPFRLLESYQDSMLSLKTLQESILAETGNTLEDYEDAYVAENAMSSQNKAQADIYRQKFYEPIQKAVASLMSDGASYDDIQKYIIAKHGLERNIVFSRRDAEKDGGSWNGKVQDYSGLTALTDDPEHFTEIAEDMVASFEKDHHTEDLWAAINAATRETLYRNYASGLMSKSAYEHVRDMFSYYVPLRGWDADVAANEYEYLTSGRPMLSPTLKAAKGRKSMADDPIATIGHMAESAIVQGNRNLMKQKFLNFVLNNPTSLATVSEQWYVIDPATDTWEPRNPSIPVDADPETVAEIVSEFEANMLAEQKAGNATRKRSGLNLGKHSTIYEGQEHVVRVKRGGKEYCIYINGNPRAAQALNGLTNPDAASGKIKEIAADIRNFMARMFTSQNPAFIVSNLSRDVIWAGTAVAIKEDAEYARRYAKNISRALAKGQIVGLVRKFSKGKLNDDVEIERYFNEFITNGGETGFTNINTIDDFKRDMKRFVKDAARGGTPLPARAWRGLWDGIEFMNRCAEDTTRFMVYLTSRQMGRSVQRSVYDAKEITVNFNKKGSGGYLNSFMNFAYIFFNATVQSLANLGKIVKRHPLKSAAAFSTFTAAGALTPLLALAVQAAFGGGDDDEDSYFDLPEWVRRNNLVFYIPWSGNGYLTIPLPHELRPFYSIGELSLSVLMGKETPENAIRKAAEGFTSLIPIDFTGNAGNMAVNFTPTIAQPFVQLVFNTDYFGKPIYKRTDYNALDPEWTKAYKGTNQVVVNATRWLSEVSGGNNVRRGSIELNPAVIEHLYESYFGGVGKTLNRSAKTISMLWDEDMRQWRNVPIASSFFQKGDERTSGSQLNREYFEYRDGEYKQVEHDFAGYKRQMRMGAMEYAEILSDFMDSPEFRRYRKLHGYISAIDRISHALKYADTESREDMEEKIRELKRELVSELHEDRAVNE